MSPEEESFPCTVTYSYNFENAGNRDNVTYLAGRQLDRVVNGQLFWWVRRLLHKLWFQGPGALGEKEETEIWIASRAGRSGPRSGMRSKKTLTCGSVLMVPLDKRGLVPSQDLMLVMKTILDSGLEGS